MIYGCIAEKLGHSFSKDIHNRLFDYPYELKEIPRDTLAAFMQSKDFKAINVTMPYKEQVIPYLDWVSETAQKIGAVNTIVNENGFLRGYNTDYPGMIALIQKNNISLQNKKVLILGSGGTSKTAMAVAESLGCSLACRVSRDQKEGCITYEDAYAVHSDAQVIINTTPVGMYPKIGISPIDISRLPKLDAVVDAVYNPLRTKLVCDARSRGINAVGGLYMLIAQAALAAEKFVDTQVSRLEIDRIYKELISGKQNIVLIGMPGSGKSTIGKLLAQETGMAFVDTDEEIVVQEQRPIPDIFQDVGEAGFRKIESHVITSLSGRQNTVIATGGGAVCNRENIDLLKENGKVYFIDRDLQDIAATFDRPLSSNREDLEKRYQERYPLYCSYSDVQIKIGNDPTHNAKMILEDFYNESTCD